MVVAVDRLFRDEDGIDSAVFAKACRLVKCVVITPYTIYDFNAPYSNAKREFVREAEVGADYIKFHIKGRMLGSRTRKAEKDGLVANGVAPIGLKAVGEKRGQLVPTSHAPIVNWLHVRFQELGASRVALLSEIAAMARRGEPLFPVANDVDPKSVFLTQVRNADGDLLGWTIKSRYGLDHLLGNPSYQGHLVFNGKVVKRDAFPQAKIVDETAWLYAYNCLADVDLDGQPIERSNQVVRYSHHDSPPNTALLAGTRYDGRAVIESVDKAQVFVAMSDKAVYRIRRGGAEFIASITVDSLDRVFEEHLLEKICSSDFLYFCNPETEQASQNLNKMVHEVGKQEAISPKPNDTLEEINSEIASLQRKLDVASDVMDKEELRRNYAKLARLKERRVDVEATIQRAATHANELSQAKEDIQLASTQYRSWDLEHKRRFIRVTTDVITLESLADGWMRLTVRWSELVGMGVEQCYIWKESSGLWETAEVDLLKQLYPTSPVSDLLCAFPTRSWAALQVKAVNEKIKRSRQNNDSGIDKHMSLSDLRVIEKYGIEPGKRVQWVSYSAGNDDTERNHEKIPGTLSKLWYI